jgi:hypothetical protein
MASPVPEQEIQRSQNAFQDSMRSIADAEKQYVPPVSNRQKQPASATPPASVTPAASVKVTARPLLQVKKWLTKEIHILPDKWRLSDRGQEIVAVFAVGVYVSAVVVYVSAFIVLIALFLIKFTPPWMVIATGIIFVTNLVRHLSRDNVSFTKFGVSVSYTKFDRFFDACDSTLWFVILVPLPWALSTYAPGWVWVAIGLTVVLVLGLTMVLGGWKLLLFAVRSLGRAWRNE